MIVYNRAQPPASGWGLDGVSSSAGGAVEVLATWVGWISWIALILCGLALIAFAGMLALDKDRGRSISASAPHVELIKIALGVGVIASAGVLASAYFGASF